MPGGTVAPWSVVEAWPEPNYEHPVKKGDALAVLCIVLAPLTTVLVALRLWCRVMIIKQPRLDDFLIILGLIFGIALTPILILGNNKYGIGVHKWDESPTKAVILRKLTYVSELLFVWSISCTKISILLFYRRLAAGSATKAFLWGTWIGVGYNVAYFITFTILPANICSPADAYWNQLNLFYKKEWSCIDEGMVLPVGAALSVVSDLYGCLLPALLLRNLQVPRRQKILLYGLFVLGFFVVVSGIVRTYYLVYLFHYTYDVTWDLYDMLIWLILEVHIAILCASAPALKPLFPPWIQAPFTKTYGSYRLRSAHSRKNTTDPAMSWDPYASKQSQRGFCPLDAKNGTAMSIFVRCDIEMASEARTKLGSAGGDDGDSDLGLSRHQFEAIPVPPQGRGFHAR